jgi:hypothetical protein
LSNQNPLLTADSNLDIRVLIAFIEFCQQDKYTPYTGSRVSCACIKLPKPGGWFLITSGLAKVNKKEV